MSETTVGAPALVTELDEERRRYETWLEQLEARRGATPDHVYARVRDDYRQRLQGVVDRLGEHAESLRASVAQLEERTEALRAEEQQVRDDRAEAELRAMVGEYAPEQWDSLQQEADVSLADLGARRAEAEADLERLRQLLALATGSLAVNTGEPEPVRERPREPEGARVGHPAEAGVTYRHERPADVLPLDGPVHPTPAGSQPPVAGRVDEELHGWSRELDEAVAPAPPAHRTEHRAEPRREQRTDQRAEPALDSSTGTAIKTLRCQECGTMNYPTEWYCERCGGELATM